MSTVIVGARTSAQPSRAASDAGPDVGIIARNRDNPETIARDLEQPGICADLEPADIRDASALGWPIASPRRSGGRTR